MNSTPALFFMWIFLHMASVPIAKTVSHTLKKVAKTIKKGKVINVKLKVKNGGRKAAPSLFLSAIAALLNVAGSG